VGNNLLSDAYRKFDRAKHHIADFQRHIEPFEREDAYKTIAEPNPDNPDQLLHKIKLAKPLPDSLAEIVGDAVNNLRESLDVALYAITVASGKVKPLNTNFPFPPNFAEFGRVLGRAKDVPEQIKALLRGFQPYKGGNDLLWALNRICVVNKHNMLIPGGVAAQRSDFSITVYTPGYVEFLSPKWDAAKQEVIIAVSSSTPEPKFHCKTTLFIAFDQVEVVGGKEVSAVLNELVSIVERILFALEAESKRLFPSAFV
jgi:hypothetical protein